MKERLINRNITIPAYDQPTAVAQPRKRPFYFVATFITSLLASILTFLFLVITAIGTDQIVAAIGQTFPQRVAVILVVGN